MVEIDFPTKNIKKRDITIWAGLSWRKLIALTVVGGYSVAAYIFVAPVIGDDLTMLSVLATAFLAIPIGFKKIYNMPFEKYAVMVVKYNFMRPRVRTRKNRNLLDEAIEAEAVSLEAEYRNISRPKTKKRR
ncbi:MAG: PrgI family protein [Lachnospiraceae bacterium]|nr:PrgI family protein [Lachnospiraceae bacterium]